MAQAELGDDVFGDDPTVVALEERAAELTGKEAALFVASGTMGNLVSLMAQVPRGGEIISLGVFYKNFDSPIEKVYIQSSGANVLSYVNAEKANNFGIELEARKNLDVIARGLRPFTMFANLTLMKSDITPGNDSISALTNSSRPMVGQSPYIVNAGLLWAQGPWSASLLYNVQGKRILEAGYEKIAEGPENVREFVRELKLPKEVLALILAQIDETKNGLYRVVAKEMRDFLDQTNLAEELTKALTTLSFEIKTEVRFIPNDARPGSAPKPDIRSRVAVKRDKRNTEPPPSEAPPPESTPPPPEEQR